jgi:hypothetical protein
LKFGSIAIIGAVSDRERYSNKAVRAYKGRGYEVYPISIRDDEIEGLKAYRSIRDVPGQVDAASLYVNPRIGIGLLEDLAEKGVSILFVNPGADSVELIEKADELGLNPVVACSIMSLGVNPNEM